MLHAFLETNRAELIERCRARAARRPAPRPTARQMEHGIPLFLGQLIETLREEHTVGRHVTSAAGTSPLTSGAARHGGELLEHGFTVDQVVHDYGDLCQAATELAIELKAPISVGEFQTLNRCIDDAIADAVTEFGWQRDRVMSEKNTRAMNEQLGFLAHELRNHLNTAVLSFAALKRGGVGVDGATSAVLERSLNGLRNLVDRALADVRLAAGVPSHVDDLPVDRFL